MALKTNEKTLPQTQIRVIFIPFKIRSDFISDSEKKLGCSLLERLSGEVFILEINFENFCLFSLGEIIKCKSYRLKFSILNDRKIDYLCSCFQTCKNWVLFHSVP